MAPWFGSVIKVHKVFFFKIEAEVIELNLSFLFFKLYLFLATLGLRCWAQAFSSCGEWGLLFIVVHGLLITVASLVAEHGL